MSDIRERLREPMVVLYDCIAALDAENKRLREALEIIAGDRPCLDNLMGNVDVAREALAKLKGEE